MLGTYRSLPGEIYWETGITHLAFSPQITYSNGYACPSANLSYHLHVDQRLVLGRSHADLQVCG